MAIYELGFVFSLLAMLNYFESEVKFCIDDGDEQQRILELGHSGYIQGSDPISDPRILSSSDNSEDRRLMESIYMVSAGRWTQLNQKLLGRLFRICEQEVRGLSLREDV